MQSSLGYNSAPVVKIDVEVTGHQPHQDQLLRNNSDSDLTNFELFCLMSAVHCTLA